MYKSKYNELKLLTTNSKRYYTQIKNVVLIKKEKEVYPPFFTAPKNQVGRYKNGNT